MDKFFEPEQTAPGIAYSQIMKMIMLKKLRPGQRLAELSLAEEIGVSRTPVREALRKLAAEGWLKMIPNSGVWVATPTKREILNAYDVRAKLEQWGVELAVPNVTPLVLDRLEEALMQEQAVYDSKIDPERYTGINNSFHFIIAETSGNNVLLQHIQTAVKRTNIYMVLYEDYLDFSNNQSLCDHKKLAEFLKERDAEQASAMIKLHVLNGFRDLNLPVY